MPVLPEYQMETRDIDTFQTRNTGGHADAADFNPFDETAARSIESAMNDISDVNERRAAKEDLLWAQNKYAGTQVSWLEKIKGYTDPEAAEKDLQADTQAVMKSAPSGRASDFFVQHMDAFAPRMARRALMNQAHAATQATVVDYTGAMSDLASLGNGTGNAPPVPLQPDNAPAQAPPIQPKLNSTDLTSVAHMVDQTNAAAKGVVPPQVQADTTATTQANLSRGAMRASMLESSPGEFANKAGVDPASVGVTPGSLDPTEVQAAVHTASVMDITQRSGAITSGVKIGARYLTGIANGNFPAPDVEKRFIEDMATLQSGKHGENKEEFQQKWQDTFQSAKDAYSVGQQTMGKTIPDTVKLLNDYQLNNVDKPEAVKEVTEKVKGMVGDLKENPGHYALNNPMFRDSYNAAYDNVSKNPNDPMAQARFQRVLMQSVEMQAATKTRTVDDAGVMPKDMAMQWVDQIQNGDVKNAVSVIKQIKGIYGDYFDNAMGDLSRNGLNQGYAVLAQFDGQPMQGRIASAILGESQGKDHLGWDKLLNAEDPQTGVKAMISNAVASAAQPYREAVGWNDQGAKGAYQIQQVIESLTKQNLYRQEGGKVNADTVKRAATNATNDVINSLYDTGGTSTGTYLIRKANTPGGDTDAVRAGLPRMQAVLAGGGFNADIGAMFGRPGDEASQDEKDTFKSAVSTYGRWINTPDDRGVQFAVQADKLSAADPNFHFDDSAGTGLWFPTDKHGLPFTVPYGMAQTWSPSFAAKTASQSVPNIETEFYLPSTFSRSRR